MDYLFQMTADETPRFNPRVVKGFARSELEDLPKQLARIFEIAAQGLPPSVKFEGLERCTPQEVWDVMTGKRKGGGSSKNTYDLARTDMFMIKYVLSLNGVKRPPAYMFLPYCGEAGTMHLRGPVYTISPVLTDMFISVSKDSIFTPFVRDRVTFYRLEHTYLKNQVQRQSYLVWTPIHRYAPKQKQQTAYKTTVGHYLFCKHGFQKAVKLYDGADVIVGTAETINWDKYSRDDYYIFSPTGFARGKARKNNIVSPMRVAVLKSECGDFTENMIATLFYVAECHPTRVLPEYCDQPGLWQILLGLMMDYTDRNEGRLLNDIKTHMESLDRYVDSIVKSDMARDNLYCNDIYELFTEITKRISNWLMFTRQANMYDKRLVVSRYVLLDYTKAIFNFVYRLNSNGRREITEKDINRAAGKFLNPNIIITLSKSHGEVNVISSPGDNYVFKHSGKIVSQADATTKRNSPKKSANCPTRQLDASYAEINSPRNMLKSDPTGRTVLSPWVMTTPDNCFIRSKQPVIRSAIDQAQELIKRV